jgi:glycosyltransferase involved in cell wall biosynthesis
MPKVSVVIPTYNRAHFLPETIQSVLAQSFQDFEIIVVDDGSVDSTKEVVDSFQDRRISYIYQENQGGSAARNTGIKASSGEYIVPLDSDDILLKDAIEKGVQTLDSHPEAAFSYGHAHLIDERGQVFSILKQRQKLSYVGKSVDKIEEFLILGDYVPGCTIMIRRKCLFDVGLFDPTFPGSQDYELVVRLTRKYPIAYIAEPLAKYRIHPGRLSANRELDEREKTDSRILEGIFSDAELSPLLSSQRSRAYFYLYLRMAERAYVEFKQMKTARQYLIKALKIYHMGFYETLGLPWILLFATWFPLPVLNWSSLFRRCLTRVRWWQLQRSLAS